jgi:hypothetical protein
LWKLTSKLPTVKLPSSVLLPLLKQPTWNSEGGDEYSPEKVVKNPNLFKEDMRRIMEVDTSYPVLLLDVDDGVPPIVFDGMHRLTKLLLVEGRTSVSVRYVPRDIASRVFF